MTQKFKDSMNRVGSQIGNYKNRAKEYIDNSWQTNEQTDERTNEQTDRQNDGHSNEHMEGHSNEHMGGHSNEHMEGHSNQHMEGHSNQHMEGHSNQHMNRKGGKMGRYKSYKNISNTGNTKYVKALLYLLIIAIIVVNSLVVVDLSDLTLKDNEKDDKIKTLAIWYMVATGIFFLLCCIGLYYKSSTEMIVATFVSFIMMGFAIYFIVISNDTVLTFEEKKRYYLITTSVCLSFCGICTGSFIKSTLSLNKRMGMMKGFLYLTVIVLAVVNSKIVETLTNVDLKDTEKEDKIKTMAIWYMVATGVVFIGCCIGLYFTRLKVRQLWGATFASLIMMGFAIYFIVVNYDKVLTFEEKKRYYLITTSVCLSFCGLCIGFF